jgi:Na+:H+ antiporter, NhaA family
MSTLNPIEEKVEKVLAPFGQFIQHQTAGSIALLLATLAAVVWANSPFEYVYTELMTTELSIHASSWVLEMDVRGWISHGLMTLFFFVLGLEIKRELIAGELRDSRKSIPVLMAAIGGMLFPASIYYLIMQSDLDLVSGLGVLMVLGARIPAGVVVFITALAIIDDLGAILVIALFYSAGLSETYLAWAFGLTVLLVIFNILGLRSTWLYGLTGVLIWYCMHHSGIHATVAGILVALAIPARPKRSETWFLSRVKQLTKKYEKAGRRQRTMLEDGNRHELAESVKETVNEATTPLQRSERSLAQPIVLLVLPAFAFANAGVSLEYEALLTAMTTPLTYGIGLGLIFGKTIGISVTTWLATKLGLGVLPDGVNHSHIFGISLLAGMGFTMSIFIAGLVFPSQEIYSLAITSILFSSLIAGFLGYLWLRFFTGGAMTRASPSP